MARRQPSERWSPSEFCYLDSCYCLRLTGWHSATSEWIGEWFRAGSPSLSRLVICYHCDLLLSHKREDQSFPVPGTTGSPSCIVDVLMEGLFLFGMFLLFCGKRCCNIYGIICIPPRCQDCVGLADYIVMVSVPLVRGC